MGTGGPQVPGQSVVTKSFQSGFLPRLCVSLLQSHTAAYISQKLKGSGKILRKVFKTADGGKEHVNQIPLPEQDKEAFSLPPHRNVLT